MEHVRDQCFSPANVLFAILRDPIPALILRWNWKSAIFSSLCRGIVFFFANLSSGVKAATGALIAEFLYRAISAGFYGSLTQAFRKSEPRWAATLVALIVIPGISHSIEFLLHWLRGTPNLRASIVASLIFTLISTLFNLHAMRRGVLLVGHDEKSLVEDMRLLPVTIWTFISTGFGLARRPGWS